MMNLLSFLSTLASVIYLFVGVNTYRLNKKSKGGILFLLLNIVMSIWAFTYSFAYTAKDNYTFYLWNKLSAVGWCLFPALALMLVLTITNHTVLEKLFVKIIIPLPGLLFLYISVFLFGPDLTTPDFIADFFYIGNSLYSYSYVILSLVIIFLWGREPNKINQKKQAEIIMVAGIIPLLADLLNQFFLPVFAHIYLPNFTQILMLITLWGINYAIVNYNFMLVSNSLIIDELFHEILDLTFLVDLNGKIIRTNKQVLNLLRYDLIDLIDTSITDIIQEKELENLITDFMNITDTIKLSHVIIHTKTGEPIPLNISVAPIRRSGNQILLGFLIVGQDIRIIEDLKYEISSHKITAKKLKKSEELFRTVAETIPFGITLTNTSDDTIIYINKNSEELFDISHDDMLGKNAFIFYQNPRDRLQLLDDLSKGRQIKEREILFKRRDGTVFSGLITMVKAVYNEKEVLLVCIADITEQKMLQKNIVKSEEMLRKLMDSIPDLVLVCNMEGNLTYVNKRIETILGYNPDTDVIPDDVFSFLDEKDAKLAKENMKKLLKEDFGTGPVEYRHIKKDGTYIDAEVNGTVLREKSSEPFGFVFVTRDITERKKIQDALKRSKEETEKINNELLENNTLLQEQSIRDGLTNLYNHRFMMELLEQEIKKSDKNKTELCLMMLDIDYFKRVNDNYGHQTGDRVLNMVAKLIKLNVRDYDYVGRYGGEEFLVLLPGISLKEACQIAENIRESIQNYNFTTRELKVSNLNITISIGLTKYQSEDIKAFINRADTLLYQAKEKGRNRTEVS